MGIPQLWSLSWERDTGQEAELRQRELIRRSLQTVLGLPLLLAKQEESTLVLLVHDKAAFDMREKTAPDLRLCKSAEPSCDQLLMCGVWENAEQ